MRTSWMINNKLDRIGIQTKLNWGINETHTQEAAEQEFSEKRAGAEAEDSDKRTRGLFLLLRFFDRRNCWRYHCY